MNQDITTLAPQHRTRTLEGVPLQDIAASIDEQGDTIARLSVEDVRAHFALTANIYTDAHHARLTTALHDTSAPQHLFWQDTIEPHALTRRMRFAELSEQQQCALQEHPTHQMSHAHYDLHLDARARDNAAQVADGGSYVFEQYISDGENRLHPEMTALHFMESVQSDPDLQRKHEIITHLAAQGCPNPDHVPQHFYQEIRDDALACYTEQLRLGEESLIYSNPARLGGLANFAVFAKDNTNSFFMRSTESLSVLRTHRDAFTKPVERILIVGPGREIVPFGYNTDFRSQIHEPFVVMDHAIRDLGADPHSLTVDMVDINPAVVQHMQDAKTRAHYGEEYALHLYQLVQSEEPVSQLPFGHSLDVSSRVLIDRRALGNIQGLWEQVRIAPEVLQRINITQGDVSADRVGEAQSYDLVIMLHVSHYLSASESDFAWSNLVNATTPGGIILTDLTPSYVYPESPCSKRNALPIHHIEGQRAHRQQLWKRGHATAPTQN